MKRPYKAKSPEAASRRVNNLRVHRQVMQERINGLIKDRFTMAKLASEKPEFNNPIVVLEAKKLRDQILNDPIYVS